MSERFSSRGDIAPKLVGAPQFGRRKGERVPVFVRKVLNFLRRSWDLDGFRVFLVPRFCVGFVECDPRRVLKFKRKASL